MSAVREIVGLILMGALIGALMVGALLGGEARREANLRDVTPVTCQEDDPCWNCETMGNRVCGPIVPTFTG